MKISGIVSSSVFLIPNGWGVVFGFDRMILLIEGSGKAEEDLFGKAQQQSCGNGRKNVGHSKKGREDAQTPSRPDCALQGYCITVLNALMMIFAPMMAAKTARPAAAAVGT